MVHLVIVMLVVEGAGSVVVLLIRVGLWWRGTIEMLRPVVSRVIVHGLSLRVVPSDGAGVLWVVSALASVEGVAVSGVSRWPANKL